MYGIISLVAVEASDLTETQVTRVSSSTHVLLFKQTKFDVKSFYASKVITKNPKD